MVEDDIRRDGSPKAPARGQGGRGRGRGRGEGRCAARGEGSSAEHEGCACSRTLAPDPAEPRSRAVAIALSGGLTLGALVGQGGLLAARAPAAWLLLPTLLLALALSGLFLRRLGAERRERRAWCSAARHYEQQVLLLNQRVRRLRQREDALSPAGDSR